MYIRYSRSAPASLPQRLLSAVLSGVLVVGGMLLMLVALVMGLVLAGGVVLWALLRGRRPGPVNLRWSYMPRPPGFGPRPARPRAADVVDVQAREVEDPPQR